MPIKISSGTKLKNTQRFNPQNTNAYTGRPHVYDDAIRVTAPPSGGRGIYKRKRNTEDI